MSKYDPKLRRGFNFGVRDSSGVTSTHANYAIVPEGAGLGVELDEDAVSEYSVSC